MNQKILFLFLLASSTLFAADHQWVLKQSTLTYHVSHPLHQSEGVSHAARGKGICHEGQCDFLIAVPVKTFDSGDSNRDLHMIQVTRGAEYPMVTVRTRLPESASTSSTVKADVEIQFAGRPRTTSNSLLNWLRRVTKRASPEPSPPLSRISRSTRPRS